MGVDLIMKSSLVRKTLDNITVLFVAFENFDNYVNRRNKEYEIYLKETTNTEEKLTPSSNNDTRMNNMQNTITSNSRVDTEITNFNNGNNNSEKNSTYNENKEIGNFNMLKTSQKSTKICINRNSNIYKDENTTATDFMKRLNFEKVKNDTAKILPPVLNTESNFRQSDGKRNNIYKSMFKDEELKKNFNRRSLDKKEKIPFKKIFSLEKRKFNSKYLDENEDSNKFSSDNNNLQSSDYKSKYHHEKIVKRIDDVNVMSKKLHTEI